MSQSAKHSLVKSETCPTLPPPLRPQLLGDTLKGFGFPDTVVKAVTTPFTVAKDGACRAVH